MKLLDRFLWRCMGHRNRHMATALQIGDILGNPHDRITDPEALELLTTIRADPEHATLKQLTRLLELLRPLRKEEDENQ